MRIKSDIKNITLVENLIEELIDKHSVNTDVYGKVLLAVVEGVNNAILHGNKGDKDKDVTIYYSIDPNFIKFNIQDQGDGFNYTNLPDPTLPENIERTSGRGIFLMKHLSDEFEFNEIGNEVRLTFNISQVKVDFYTEEVTMPEINQDNINKWFTDAIQKFKFEVGELSIIFTSDDYLLKMNQQYLQHDYLTDIITFNYSSKDRISGDLFISVDRIEDNAKIFNVEFTHELHRVMIHGVLHLIGFDDNTPENASDMKKQENFWLTHFSSTL